MKNPSVIISPSGRVPEKASRWFVVVLELAVVEKIFCGLLCWFHDFREFIEAELGQMKLGGPHKPPGRALKEICSRGINKVVIFMFPYS